MIDINQLTSLEIEKLLSLDMPNYEVFFKLSKTKVIRYTRPMEDNREALNSLKAKGVTDVFLSKKEYKRFIKDQISINKTRIKEASETKNNTLEKSIESLDSSHELIKNAISKLGLEKNTLELVEELNTDTFLFINKVKDFRILLKNFEKNSKKGFAKNLLTSYFLISMTKSFKWANKGKMLERLSLGVFLANLGLKDEDLKLIKTQPTKKLPDHIINNSSKLITFLEKNNQKLHEDVKQLIEQHHEKPDGKGFPRGLQARQINLYAAIYIISYKFSDLLFETNFSFEDINKAFYKIKDEYSFYVKLNNNFTRSFDVFEIMCAGLGINTTLEYEVDNE